MVPTITRTLILATLVGGSVFAQSAGPDEPLNRAKALKAEAEALARQGKPEAAERLGRQARELVEQAERRGDAPRPDVAREVTRLEEQLRDLRAKHAALERSDAPERERVEVRAHAVRVQEELASLRRKLDGARPPRPEFEAQARELAEAGRRLRHIRIAAENLEAAGVRDLAAKLRDQASDMERSIAEAKQRLAREAGAQGGDPRDAEIRELRRQNERLQAELQELRRNRERR